MPIRGPPRNQVLGLIPCPGPEVLSRSQRPPTSLIFGTARRALDKAASSRPVEPPLSISDMGVAMQQRVDRTPAYLRYAELIGGHDQTNDQSPHP